MADTLVEHTCNYTLPSISAYHLFSEKVAIYSPPVQIGAGTRSNVPSRIVDNNELDISFARDKCVLQQRLHDLVIDEYILDDLDPRQ